MDSNRVYSKTYRNRTSWYSNGLLFKITDIPRESYKGYKGSAGGFIIEWYKPFDPAHENPILHRDNGLPAFECANGDSGDPCEDSGDTREPRRREETSRERLRGARDTARREWWVDGKQHRDNNLPAVEWTNGNKEWWVDGERHRDNGLPAVEYTNKNSEARQEWWIRGKRHRCGPHGVDNDLPAVEFMDGDKMWYVNGERHRDNDLPAVVCTDGTKMWYVNGEHHRCGPHGVDNDLPAIVRADGTKMWWVNGKLLRTVHDLPSVEDTNEDSCDTREDSERRREPRERHQGACLMTEVTNKLPLLIGNGT